MTRKVLAACVGIVVMGSVVGGVETLGHYVYPPPAGFDLSKTEDMARLMEVMPNQALAFMVLAWILGALIGAWVAARIARPQGLWPALVVGIAMLLASGGSMLMIPHPGWMVAFGLITPLPIAWAMGRWQGGAGLTR